MLLVRLCRTRRCPVLNSYIIYNRRMAERVFQPCFSGRCPGFYKQCKILGSGFLFFFCRKKLYIDFTDRFFWILHKDFTIRLVRNKNAVTGRSPKKQLPMMIQDHKGKTYAAKQQSRTEKGEKKL